MRYDAAIIGAGPDGLATATRLARAGLSTIVIDQAATAGARCVTREFYPGFRASPFQDELAEIPAEIFWQLDLARRGALFLPDAEHVVLHADDRRSAFRGTSALLAAARERIRQALDDNTAEAQTPAPTGWFRRSRNKAAAPLEKWSERSLLDCLADCAPEEAATLLARTLSGRTADPSLRGTAVKLLALASSGVVAGGLGRLTEALCAAARDAGVQFTLGIEASELHLKDGKVSGLILADGMAVEAACVVSTLDLKRTFLSLFQWSELPDPIVKRAAAYRSAGATARLLVALEGLAGNSRSVFHLHVEPEDLALANSHWRAGVLHEHPPATIRVVSASDPALAPRGDATATVTLGAIPHHLFDGPWTVEKRQVLRDRALASLAVALPGAKVIASELIVPTDIEEILGLTQGDLDGGELAPDQMFGARAFRECPRTPLAGLYLAGASSALGASTTVASGWLAAAAVLADRKAGRLK